MSTLSNENSLLRRQLEVAHGETEVVRGALEEQVRAETTAARDLRGRVTELNGVREKWEAEQERVKVGIVLRSPVETLFRLFFCFANVQRKSFCSIPLQVANLGNCVTLFLCRSYSTS